MYNIVAFIIVFALNCIYYKPAFTFAMICFGILCIFEYKKKQLQLPMIDPIILKSFGVFWAGVILASILTYDIECIKKAFDYVYWTLPFWMIVILGYNKNIIKGLVIGLIVSTIVICIYGLHQYIFLPMTRLQSFYSSSNYMGTILAMLIPFLIMFMFVSYNKLYKLFLLFAASLSIVCLYFTQSRGAIIGIIIGSFIYIIYIVYTLNIQKNYKKVFLFFSIIMVVFGTYVISIHSFTRFNDNERIYIFQSSINMWSDHKIIGVGLGNFRELYSKKYMLPQAKIQHINKSHNIITSFLAETGIVGASSFIFLNCGILYFIIKKIKYNFILGAFLVAFIALNVHGIVDSTFNYQAINRLFWGLFGIGYIYK